VVCFGRKPIPAAPSQIERYDCEYIDLAFHQLVGM
jgi:hypothetical protein